MSFCLSAIVHYSPEEMFRGALQAARDVTQGEWELGGWLLAIERTKAFEAAGFRGTVGFAMVRLGLEPQKATNLLRIMSALEGLPKLSAAFRSGEMGYGKIREITRVATEETEQAWLEFAHSHTTEQVRQRVVCSPSAFERRLRSVRARADGLLNFGDKNEPPLPASSVAAQIPAPHSEATARFVGSAPGESARECPGLTLDPDTAGTPAKQNSVGQRSNPAVEVDGESTWGSISVPRSMPSGNRRSRGSLVSLAAASVTKMSSWSWSAATWPAQAARPSSATRWSSDSSRPELGSCKPTEAHWPYRPKAWKTILPAPAR